MRRDLGFGPRGTPAERWLHEPQPFSNRSVGLGFPHLSGRYRRGGSAVSSPGCWSCREIEGFLTRGWEFILFGCGGTSPLARGATLATRWLHEPQPISNHPVGLGFAHPAGRYRPGGSAVSSRLVGVVEIRKVFVDGSLSLPGAGEPRVGQRGNSRRALAT